MECLECGGEFDEEFDDDCPYCGCSKDAVICPNCDCVVDDDMTCSMCGYMLHDEYEDYYNSDSENDDESEDDDDSFEDMESSDDICENCAHWQAHPNGFAYGMICQKTGQNTDPDDSCEYFSKMFHFSNYGEEGQYSFIDTKREKKRKLDYWRNRKF